MSQQPDGGTRNQGPEQQAKDVIVASGLPIADVDLDRRIEFANAAFAKLLKRSPDELIGMCTELIHPDDLVKTAEAFQKLIAGTYVPPYVVRIVAADGEVIPVELYSSALYDEGGDIVGVRCVFVDQRSLDAANRKLANVESTVKGLLEASPDLAYCKDADGRFTWVSSSLLERVQKKAEEMLGKTTLEVFGPEIAALVAEDDAQVLQGGMVVKERTVSYGGQEGVVLFFKAPILDPSGGVTGIACFIRDLTEKHKEQERIRLSEQRYRAVSQLVATYSLSMSVLPDGNTEVEWVEGDFEKILGRPAKGFYESGGLRTVVHPDDKQILERRRERILRGRPSTDEFRIVRPDGQIRWLRAFAGPETDEHGAVVRVYAAVADITAQKQLEERAKVVSRFESLGQIAAGIGHDMSNWLQSLLTNLELAQRRLDADAPKQEIRELISKCIARLDAMRDMARGLVQFATDEGLSTQTDVSAEIARMTPLLKEAVRTNVELNVRTPKRSLPVRISVGTLQQILTNLILNASDAMPDGGMVRVSAQSVHITQPTDSHYGLSLSPGYYALIRVSDSGPGVPDEIRQRIFEPFVTTRRDAGHSGLGLTIVLRHVAAAGGSVQVEKNRPRGTTFRIYLPLVAAETPVTQAAVHLPIVILVVDDDPANRLSLQAALSDAGYIVSTAASCEEALEVARRRARPFDCVLTDFSLPDGSGDELGKTLVSEASALRYGLITSETPPTSEAPVLRKPFTQQQLIEFVEAQLCRSVAG